MKIKEQKEVIVKKEVFVSCVCDNCKREEHDEDEIDSWFCFSSYHSERWNDSSDSVENYDACCYSCYIDLVRYALADLKGYEQTLDIDGMGYKQVCSLLDYIDLLKVK